MTTIRKRKDYQLAVVEVFSGPSFLWAEVVCWSLRLLNKPYVLTLHGGNLPAFSQRWPKRMRFLLQKAAKITTPSRYLKDNLSLYSHQIQYLPNALDLLNYSFRVCSRPAPRISWLRALRYIYNPVLALRTLGLLAVEFPSIHLDMIGPDQKDGSLELVLKTADKFGVQDNVRLVGGVPKREVPSRLAQSDIFLNTTNYESFGVTVMEAAACGLCIVTTNVGELPYLWKDGHDALLVPPDDPEAMAAAVRRILTEPGLAERLSRNARQKAEQFDWSLILPQWEALLTAVAEGHYR
ncbi:MAG: glycosyltransferase family 4 protein [Firmicutes bacterium]|nr:glycosyltransferase family 4 protein [Bacillota bacterium]